MCIAIYVPKGELIPYDHLVEGQKHNPDGCGMSWVEDGEIKIFKSMSFEKWSENYFDVLSRLGAVDMLIHFRITSRGQTREDMCHPFKINDNLCVIHNGTISNIKPAETKDGVSDTYVLATQILANLPDGWEYNAAIARLIEEFIGWSKLCVMDRTGGVYIFNEDSGVWDGGIWYSNKSYMSYTPVKTTPPTTTPSTNVYSFPNTNNTLGRDYSKDNCDGCMKEFDYKNLKYHDCKLLCCACYIIDKRESEKKTYQSTFGGTIYRPCGCCRTLTDKEEMWKVEIEFNDTLENDFHLPTAEQVSVYYQYDLLAIHAMRSDTASTWLCSECYEASITLEIPNVVTVTLCESPEKYTEEEIEKMFS